MSMTREQIDELENAMLYQDWGRVVRVISMGNLAIAERALPVTRELLDKRFRKPKKFVGDRAWLLQENAFVREEGSRYAVRKSCGYFVDYVETLGQLLDLLSGLGVRK